MASKRFLSADQLLEDAFTLGARILGSGYCPDLLVGVWRGGSPVAIAIHELLAYHGLSPDHIPVRTQLYSDIDQRDDQVEITGLDYIAKKPGVFKSLLLVDDVFDSGATMAALVSALEAIYENTGHGRPEIRIATPWYKPARNTTPLEPHYHLHVTDDWLVFPHELCGLDSAELRAAKPGIARIRKLFR